MRLLLLLLTLCKGPGKELGCIGMSQARSVLTWEAGKLCLMRLWFINPPRVNQCKSKTLRLRQVVLAGNQSRSCGCYQLSSLSTGDKLQSSCKEAQQQQTHSGREVTWDWSIWITSNFPCGAAASLPSSCCFLSRVLLGHETVHGHRSEQIRVCCCPKFSNEYLQTVCLKWGVQLFRKNSDTYTTWWQVIKISEAKERKKKSSCY